jgi:hypothetical protein
MLKYFKKRNQEKVLDNIELEVLKKKYNNRLSRLLELEWIIFRRQLNSEQQQKTFVID